MTHDFKAWPELTNNQMDLYYFESPHKQITDDFTAEVVGVHDADTVRVKWSERDFTFPIRFADTAAPEIDTADGRTAQKFMQTRLLGKTIDVTINPDNRVDKWGRILGLVSEGGQDVGEELIMRGLATSWADRNENQDLR